MERLCKETFDEDLAFVTATMETSFDIYIYIFIFFLEEVEEVLVEVLEGILRPSMQILSRGLALRFCREIILTHV